MHPATRRLRPALILLALTLAAAALPGRVVAQSPTRGAAISATQPSTAAAGRYRPTDRWLTGARPRAIAVDNRGRVLVAVGDKVVTYTRSGRRIRSFVSGVGTPYGMTVAPNGHIYLSEFGGSPSAVHAFNASGRHLGMFTEDDGSSFSPWGLATRTNGQLWIANATGDAVERTDPPAAPIGGYGTGNGRFDTPVDVASGNKSMYVVDADNHRIQRFRATSGAFQATWGQAGTGRGQFNSPISVDVGKGGVVLVLDSAEVGNSQLEAFRPGGRYLATSTIKASKAFGLATDDRGNVYVSGLLPYPGGGWGVVRLSPR